MTGIQNNPNSAIRPPHIHDIPDHGSTVAGPTQNVVNLDILKAAAIDGQSGVEMLDPPRHEVSSSLLATLGGRLSGVQDEIAGMSTLMTLILKMSINQREGAREARNASREIEYAELQSAADKIREAANFALASAIVSGTMQIAGGAVSIAGSAKALNNGKNPSQEIDSHNASIKSIQEKLANPQPGDDVDSLESDLDHHQTAIQAQSAKLEYVNTKSRSVEGSAQIVSSAGGILGGILNRFEAERQAEQKEHDAASQKFETFAQNEEDFRRSADEMISSVRQLLQDIYQSNAQGERAAVQV
ncbi:MAG: type III secretion system translocon subunit SctB [Planctomycetaceae bacterium]|nr:type III secretion system translocon subunit SctB [Planctomycetaceae bacterium]